MKDDPSNPTERHNLCEQGGVGSPGANKDKRTSQGGGNKAACHTLNTMARGFSRGEETSYSRKRYARQILSIENLPEIKNMHEPGQDFDGLTTNLGNFILGLSPTLTSLYRAELTNWVKVFNRITMIQCEILYRDNLEPMKHFLEAEHSN